MIIHIGWIGSKIPDHISAKIEDINAISPSSKVMFHSNETNVPNNLVKLMDSINLKPEMRSDIQRHYALKEYGGLWLDLDVELIVDPIIWTQNWNKYTAIKLYTGPSMIGTDIIYVPKSWGGWDLIENEINSVINTTINTRKVSVLALAHKMIHKCSIKSPELFSILEPQDKFPFLLRSFNSNSVVARGFKKPEIIPQGATVFTKTSKQESTVQYGPGTNLKNILKDWLGIIAEGGCACNSMASKMDRLGVEWCESEEGTREILSVMKSEHSKRRSDNRVKIPWSDIGAKQLIKLACYRSKIHN